MNPRPCAPARGFLRAWTTCLLPLLLAPAGAVSLRADGEHWIAEGAAYRMVVGPEGWIASLAAEGVEFLRPGGQGGYCYQRRVLPQTGLRQRDAQTLQAESVAGPLTLRFDDAGVTWQLTNTSTELLQYILVLAPEVDVVRSALGRYHQAPREESLREATFFRDTAWLHLAGSTRIWGPFAQQYQVWELRIMPGESKDIRLTAGASSPAELAAVKAERERIIEPPTDPVGPMWSLERLGTAPETWPAEGFDEPGLRAIFYEGEPYEGRPTRVFAWLGLPDRPAGEKVPGMVLVHGGGGTAFPEWVRQWTARGYAAISMDTCGCTSGGTHGDRPRHADGGPPGWGGLAQLDAPRTDQWSYHAVAAVIRANSLLRSLPEVDPDRIGLTGISWGGYLTCLIAGTDPRFAFAAPVYGCGDYTQTSFGTSLRGLDETQRDRWLRWWDPLTALPEARLPMLWVSGSNDFAFWFPALQTSYRTAPGERTLAIRLRMPHGQNEGAAPPEIPIFADHLFRGTPGLPRITATGRDGDRVWCTVDSPVPLDRAELNTTPDRTSPWPERPWTATPATLTTGRVEATLPADTALWYLNLFDTRGCVVSTEHETIPGEGG